MIDLSSEENIKIPQKDISNNIGTSIISQIEKYNSCQVWDEKFDRLFSLTLTLKHFEHLLQESEEIEKTQNSLDNLANEWKDLLSKSDEDLGIDSEVSRKGIPAFLETFAKQISNKFKFEV